MTNQKSQFGFSAIEALIIVVILAIIGAAGWTVYHRHKTSSGEPASTSLSQAGSAKATNVSTTPAVNSTSDLDNALNTLNQNDPSAANASDSSQLSSQSNF